MAKKSVDVRSKFAAARQSMNDAMLEREDEVDIILTALIANEHPFFAGEPGTGKSMLCDALLALLTDTEKFQILFTKSTAMEEVVGPIDVQGMVNGQYRRIVKGKLPTAHVAFADEIWKGSGAVLNAILKMTNERMFDSGDGLRPVPLRIMVAASNEFPDNDLSALYDRFLFRRIVKPVSRWNRDELLWNGPRKVTYKHNISLTELDQSHKESLQIQFNEPAKEAFVTILDELSKEGIVTGVTRRVMKAVAAAQAYCYLDGNYSEVRPDHLSILSHVLWTDPDQIETVKKIVMRVANPVALRIADLLNQVHSIMQNRNPTEMIVKLQAVRDDLTKLDHPRADAAAQLVARNIKVAYDREIGLVK